MTEESARPQRWKRWVIAGVVVAVVAGVTVPVVMVWTAWNRIERVEFDTESAREQLAALETTTSFADIDAISPDDPGALVTGTTLEDFTPEVPATVPGASTSTRWGRVG